MKTSQTNNGITLVELLIVTSVLGIIVMIAHPRIVFSLEDSRLRSGAAKVTTAIETAQLKAVHTGQRTRVIFDTVADTLQVEQYLLPSTVSGGADVLNENDVELGNFEPMEDPFDPGKDYALALKDPVFYDGVDLVGAVFGAGSTLTFSAFGAPQNGGTVSLVCGVRQTRVNVDPLTGKVTVTH